MNQSLSIHKPIYHLWAYWKWLVANNSKNTQNSVVATEVSSWLESAAYWLIYWLWIESHKWVEITEEISTNLSFCPRQDKVNDAWPDHRCLLNLFFCFGGFFENFCSRWPVLSITKYFLMSNLCHSFLHLLSSCSSHLSSLPYFCVSLEVWWLQPNNIPAKVLPGPSR